MNRAPKGTVRAREDEKISIGRWRGSACRGRALARDRRRSRPGFSAAGRFNQGAGQNTRSRCPSGSAARKVRPKSIVTGSCRMAAPLRLWSAQSASTSSAGPTAIASSPVSPAPPGAGLTSRRAHKPSLRSGESSNMTKFGEEFEWLAFEQASVEGAACLRLIDVEQDEMRHGHGIAPFIEEEAILAREERQIPSAASLRRRDAFAEAPVLEQAPAA